MSDRMQVRHLTGKGIETDMEADLEMDACFVDLCLDCMKCRGRWMQTGRSGDGWSMRLR